MTLSAHQRAFTQDIGHLIAYAYSNGLELTFGDAYRNLTTQQDYVRRGLSRTMDSYHLKRLAVDLNLFIEDVYQTSSPPYKPLGDFWKSLNEHNVWGGDFRGLGDANHFERRPA